MFDVLAIDLFSYTYILYTDKADIHPAVFAEI